MANQGPGEKMGALLSKACTDEDFRQRLLADPEGTLRAGGISLPPKAKVKVVENTADLIHIVLPAKQEALPDEALGTVTAGSNRGSMPPVPPPIPDMPGDKDYSKLCRNYSCPKDFNSIECNLYFLITFGHCVFIT